MCKVTGRSIEITLTQMTGIFLSIYRISETICYIPMMLADKRTLKYQNTSKINCGLNFYYGQHENVTELSIPPQGEISHIASLVLIILALVTSVITLILLKPLQTLTMTELNADPEPRSWMSTINLIKTQQLRLIIPMTLFSGYEKVFLRYDYLMAYIGCNKNRYDGMDQYILGTVLYCQMSLSIAPLVSTVNTEIILLVAGILYLIPTLLLLANVKIEAIGYYCISGIWSLASSIWDCLIHALYGVLFPKDELEAYAQMGLWQSISIAMSVLLTLFSGTFVKLWILLILSLLSIITVILLPFIKSGLHNKINAAEEDITLMHRANLRSDWNNEPGQKIQTVSFKKSSEGKIEYSTEIKSFSTMRYHHIHILKEREDFTKDLTEQESKTVERFESSISQTF
ncbi:UNC93-like protein isoform X4 [Cephus cinctus]|nr:UNC93-like protein isoform X4 [Cephus cinctus]XP_024937029.1 UNC93-like protein isoform X4 [Cephus cinctus]